MQLLIAAAMFLAPSVTVVSTPNGGIQPQAATDAKGRIHLIYYTGDARAGDLDYVVSEDGKNWSKPVQVNSTPGSAIAGGTIRGGQIAVSPRGDVHVVWLGTTKPMSLCYSRLARGTSKFTVQRDMQDGTLHMDGGASVAADDKNVHIVWHAAAKEEDGEAQRQVWRRSSADSGATFGKRAAVSSTVGACACCSVKAAMDGGGARVLFRSAVGGMDRDVIETGFRGGALAELTVRDKWKVHMCPMSSFALAGDWAAWETMGVVKANGIAMPGKSAKHPTLARIGDTVLCAYVLGSGWQKGGTLGWCLLDSRGKILESNLNAGQIPVWSLASAVATRTGSYLVFR
jgi:hypothetical protein